MKESHNSLKGKLDGLERYISDLPAPEELNKNAEDISFYHIFGTLFCRNNPKSAYAINSFPPNGYQPAVMITGNHSF